EPANALSQQPRVEIHQQSDSLLHDAQVCQKLGVEYREKGCNTLEFNDHRIFDEEVDLVFAEKAALVVGRHLRLVNVLDPSFVELNAHGGIVDGLEQARPEMTMHLDRC